MTRSFAFDRPGGIRFGAALEEFFARVRGTLAMRYLEGLNVATTRARRRRSAKVGPQRVARPWMGCARSRGVSCVDSLASLGNGS